MTPIVKGTTAVFWGRVSGKDATYKELGNNRRVSNFSLQYDSLPGEDVGRRKGVYINCSAWNEVADFAQNLERGDTVLCAGYLVKDEYRSNRENADIYQLTCDFISVMH